MDDFYKRWFFGFGLCFLLISSIFLFVSVDTETVIENLRSLNKQEEVVERYCEKWICDWLSDECRCVSYINIFGDS